MQGPRSKAGVLRAGAVGLAIAISAGGAPGIAKAAPAGEMLTAPGAAAKPPAPKEPTKTAPAKPAAKLAAKSGPLPTDAGPPLDLEAVKDKLVVLSDGKRHYVAVVPFGTGTDNLYYGDGKVFWLQRVASGGSSGSEFFTKSFWEPRVATPTEATVTFRDGKYTVDCGERKTELRALSADEQKTLVGEAKFFAPRWKHKAYALARDTHGRYFYVDQPREPEQPRRFRLFSGMKGSVKALKLANVVNDSAGDIFSTPGGSLRLSFAKNESFWDEGARSTPLVTLPLEANQVLIYAGLGVYAGERLGTPCDDL